MKKFVYKRYFASRGKAKCMKPWRSGKKVFRYRFLRVEGEERFPEKFVHPG
jgi:hypothetical protein